MNLCNHCSAPPINYIVNNYYYGPAPPPPEYHAPYHAYPNAHSYVNTPTPYTNSASYSNYPEQQQQAPPQGQRSEVSSGLVGALNNLANQFQAHVTQDVMSRAPRGTGSHPLSNSIVLNPAGAGFLLDPSQLPALMQQGPRRGMEMLLVTRNENGEWTFSSWENDHGVPPHLTQEQIDLLPCETASRELENQACSICQNSFMEGESFITLPCRHYFHTSCVSHWLLRASTCPLCREVVTVPEDVPEPPLSP